MNYYVYMMANQRNGTIYVGVTNDLLRRVYEHKNGLVEGFSKKYGLHMLVWFEQSESIKSAITREKQLKKWNREWKTELIESANPYWNDLWDDIKD